MGLLTLGVLVLLYIGADRLGIYLMLRQVDRSPVGIEVIHRPNPAWARETRHELGWPYGWLFETTVRALEMDLKIEWYGMAVWHRGRWVFRMNSRSLRLFGWPLNTGSFNKAIFAASFQCPGGLLEAGKEYADRNNWAGSGRLESFRQRWFFVARDMEGRRFKGEAIIELIGELVESDEIEGSESGKS